MLIFLDASDASTHVHCSSFKNAKQNQFCSSGQNVGTWNLTNKLDKESRCIIECRSYGAHHGPGCCELAEGGNCSYFVKGKTTEGHINKELLGNVKTSICALCSDSGIIYICTSIR